MPLKMKKNIKMNVLHDVENDETEINDGRNR